MPVTGLRPRPDDPLGSALTRVLLTLVPPEPKQSLARIRMQAQPTPTTTPGESVCAHAFPMHSGPISPGSHTLARTPYSQLLDPSVRTAPKSNASNRGHVRTDPQRLTEPCATPVSVRSDRGGPGVHLDSEVGTHKSVCDYSPSH